jgi:hypothetical protein
MQDLEIGNPKFFKTFSIVLSVVDYLENGIRTCLGGPVPTLQRCRPIRFDLQGQKALMEARISFKFCLLHIHRVCKHVVTSN